MKRVRRMIRILFFIENLTEGGAEKVLRNLVNNMDQTKFDVTVQTVWPCDFEKYLVKGIKYKAMYSARNTVNQYRYRIEAESGLAYRLHVKDDYDIECAYLEAGATKIMAASTNKKAKKLAWVHCDLKKATGDPEAFAEKTKPYYAKFGKVICVSENVRDSFVELFGDTVPAEVLYNTIDDEEIRGKSEKALPEDIQKRRFTVLTVGRLSAPKKYLRMLKAHKRLLDEGIGHDLWIAGEGPERAELEKYITDNGLEDSTKLLGFRDNPYCFMSEAELLACSSDYEGFSTFVTEGVILGKPIVTTDCGGMREILGDSEFGLITELSDDGLYEGLKQMLTDAPLREKYAEKAAERGKEFSAAQLTKKTEAYFEELIEK